MRLGLMTVLASILVSSGLVAKTNDLDLAFLRERLRKSYGDYSLKPGSTWQVYWDGGSQKWKWDGQSFSCPAGAPVNCKEWNPLALQWWASSTGGWQKNWSPTDKVGYEFSRLIAGGTAKDSSDESAAVAANALEAGDPNSSTQEAKFEGKTSANEVWMWVGPQNVEVRAYVALRDYWIEKFEYEGVSEYLEWAKKPGKGTPELNRVVLERAGKRVIITRPTVAAATSPAK